MPDVEAPLGWQVIAGHELLNALRRVQDGENADLVYAEIWANSEHDSREDNDG